MDLLDEEKKLLFIIREAIESQTRIAPQLLAVPEIKETLEIVSLLQKRVEARKAFLQHMGEDLKTISASTQSELSQLQQLMKNLQAW